MSRFRSVVLTIAALVIASLSFVPPWVAVGPIGGTRLGETPRLVVTHPMGSYPLFAPPSSTGGWVVRVDYARLVLYYLGTLSLVVPAFLLSVPRNDKRRVISANESPDQDVDLVGGDP